MNKAAQLARSLEQVTVAAGMKLIEEANMKAIHFDDIHGAMCIMHNDGSVNIIESVGNGRIACEVISSSNILKVLQHYRPFTDVFKGTVQ